MDTRDRTKLGILGALADVRNSSETDSTANRNATTSEGGDAELDGIRETLQHIVGRHATAGHGALGPALTELEETDLIHRRGERYSIAPAGEGRLRELLRTPIADFDDPAQEPRLRMKLAFLHHLPADEQRAELDDLADRIRADRDEWVDVQSRHTRELDSETGYRRAMLDLNVRVADAYLEWIEDVRERLAPAP